MPHWQLLQQQQRNLQWNDELQLAARQLLHASELRLDPLQLERAKCCHIFLNPLDVRGDRQPASWYPSSFSSFHWEIELLQAYHLTLSIFSYARNNNALSSR